MSIVTIGLLASRLSGRPTELVDERELSNLHSALISSRWPLAALRYNDAIGYEMTPRVSARVGVGDGSFAINSHMFGYRIPEGASQEAFEPGGVLAIGCSFTYGDEVEAEETFSYRLGEAMGVPTYNFGVCSYSYVSSLLQLEELDARGVLDELRPSIVLLGAGGWLSPRSVSPFFPTNELQFGYAYLGRDGDVMAIKQPKEEYSLRHMFELRSAYFPDGSRDNELTPWRRQLLLRIAPRVLHAVRDRDGFVPEVAPAEVLPFVIPRLHAISSRHGALLVVLWMPLSDSDSPPSELVQQLAGPDDARLVNGVEALRRWPVEKIKKWSHYSPETHRIMARLIAEQVAVMPRTVTQTH